MISQALQSTDITQLSASDRQALIAYHDRYNVICHQVIEIGSGIPLTGLLETEEEAREALSQVKTPARIRKQTFFFDSWDEPGRAVILAELKAIKNPTN